MKSLRHFFLALFCLMVIVSITCVLSAKNTPQFNCGIFIFGLSSFIVTLLLLIEERKI